MDEEARLDQIRSLWVQLARANESLRRSEAFLADGQKISRTGSWGWDLSTRKVIWSEEQYRLLGFEPGSVEHAEC